MPPSHCIIERHSSSDRGRASSPERTVAPVVVKPDTDSKSASIAAMRGSGQVANGIAPITQTEIQTRLTVRKASRWPSTRRAPFSHKSRPPPQPSAVTTASPNGCQGSPSQAANVIGVARMPARPSHTTPSSHPTADKFIAALSPAGLLLDHL